MRMHAILCLSDFLLTPPTTQIPNFAFNPSFYFGFGFLGVIRTSFLDAISSLRSNTEPENELEAGRTSFLDALSASLLNESCDENK